MPRLLVLSTLPHRRPENHRFERVTGWQSLRMVAPRPGNWLANLESRSSAGLDLYTWLTYRMSYLRKPTLVPWKGLQAQLGAGYARPRDFRRTVLARLEDVVAAYPELRIKGETYGLRLYP